MNPRYLLAAALLVSLISGCQSAREAYMVDAINTGDLILEDKIYELSNRIDELEARLDLVRGNRPARPLIQPEGESGEPSTPSSESTSPEEEPDLTPPEVEPGTPANPDNAPGADADENTSTARKASYVTADSDDDVVDVAIAEVRPENFDNQPGEDGIVVVLDPKNRRGETILEPAKIEVIVGDPALRSLGKGGHIGRWEFPPDSVAHSMQSTDRLQAIVLELPWTQIPQHNKLDLFVQYTRPDGERLQSRTRFNANLHQTPSPGQNASSQWSPRSASAPRRPPPKIDPVPAAASDQEDGPPVEVYQ